MSAYECEECGWPWPLSFTPGPLAECDNCGGQLVEAAEAEPRSTP